MKKYFKIFVIVIILLMLTSFCNENDDQFICTDEFRSVIITVNGRTLNKYFTIRESNGDTIRINRDYYLPNVYPVLDDTYQSKLENKIGNFWFKGFVNDSLVVNEIFVITADKCHIQYISGKTEINL